MRVNLAFHVCFLFPPPVTHPSFLFSRAQKASVQGIGAWVRYEWKAVLRVTGPLQWSSRSREGGSTAPGYTGYQMGRFGMVAWW